MSTILAPSAPGSIGLAYADWEMAVRESLREKIMAAWSPKKVYDDPQEIADVAGSLPLARILLFDTVPDEEHSSLSVEAVRLEYSLSLSEAKPTAAQVASSGRSLHAQRSARVEALRRLITQSQHLSTRLGQVSYEWLGDQLLPRSIEEVEKEVRNSWYSVTVMLAVVVRPQPYASSSPQRGYESSEPAPRNDMAGGYQRLPGIQG